jgi:mono/diheme cytochrome c family protein
MPSLAAGLTNQQIDAIAKYVVKTLGPQPRQAGARPPGSED